MKCKHWGHAKVGSKWAPGFQADLDQSWGDKGETSGWDWAQLPQMLAGQGNQPQTLQGTTVSLMYSHTNCPGTNTSLLLPTVIL